MKPSEAAKCFEECFGPDNANGAGGCLYDNCPLHEEIEIVVGDRSNETGQITWKIEGCSMLVAFEDQLKDKEAGTLL